MPKLRSWLWSPKPAVNAVRIATLSSVLAAVLICMHQPMLIREHLVSIGITLPEGSVDRRNAMSLASVCASAQAAGWDFVAEGGGDLDRTLYDLVRGHTINDPSSPFHKTYFGVPNLSARELRRAKRYLGFDKVSGTMLIYQEP